MSWNKNLSWNLLAHFFRSSTRDDLLKFELAYESKNLNRLLINNRRYYNKLQQGFKMRWKANRHVILFSGIPLPLTDLDLILNTPNNFSSMHNLFRITLKKLKFEYYFLRPALSFQKSLTYLIRTFLLHKTISLITWSL